MEHYGDVADRCVEVGHGGEFATAAESATRTESAAGCPPDRGQPLTVMFELPLLWYPSVAMIK